MHCNCASVALRARLGKIIVGYTRSKKTPVTAADLLADGAMTALLKDAIQPNVVQTLENNPALVHGGPFANIAHGCSSVLSTQAGLRLAEFTVTEAGFGADLGAQKFLDIKCRKTGLVPDVAVVVATCRALKLHGNVNAKELGEENVAAVNAGMPNLVRHVENLRKYGLPVVVAINQFPLDTEAELAAVEAACSAVGVDAVRATHWNTGGAGAADLATKVAEVADGRAPGAKHDEFKLLYPDDMPLEEKIRTIATEIYGASGIAVDAAARTKLKKFEKMGYGHYPVCMAKTQYSFADDAKLTGAPSDHVIPVQDVRLSAGAEFVVVLTGGVMTMPGLSRKPSAQNVGVDANGDYYGLF